VQNVIRESFRGCTIIMVAHRIHTLLDFDQVAVLNSGQIIEVGDPRDLLDEPNGEFSKLLSLES
jgi:ABC-type multidrug transport system fused ATPase/permease subunit